MSEPRLFTLQLDPELHRRLKITAAKRDQPMSEIVREAIREWMEKHEEESAGNKATPQREAA